MLYANSCKLFLQLPRPLNLRPPFGERHQVEHLDPPRPEFPLTVHLLIFVVQPPSANQALVSSGCPVLQRAGASRTISLHVENMVGKKWLDLKRPSTAIKFLERLATLGHPSSQRTEIYRSILSKEIRHAFSILGFDRKAIFVGEFLDLLTIP